MHYLTKSDFLKYLVCPEYLWLIKNKPEIVPVDEGEAIVRRLAQVEEISLLAKSLFPEGLMISNTSPDPIEETRKAMKRNVKTLFNPHILSPEGYLVSSDIAVYDKEKDVWDLYVVKSENKIKSDNYYDLGFQTLAWESSGYKIRNTVLIHLNETYKRELVVDPKSIFLFSNLKTAIVENYSDLQKLAEEAILKVNEIEEPLGCGCRFLPQSRHCPTFNYLNKDIPEYSVLNLARIRPDVITDVVSNIGYDISNIPIEKPVYILKSYDGTQENYQYGPIELSRIQRNQVKTYQRKKPMRRKKDIEEVLEGLEYPLYFLDYETISTAIPIFKGDHPYKQVPFQYSLHVQEEKNGPIKHYEFIAEDMHTSPVPQLLKSLSKYIDPNKGTVVVWHASFEKKRNEEMAMDHTEYASFLEGINKRVFDLEKIFLDQKYVSHKFKGKTSIKYVLPALVPALSYKGLSIQNGRSATIAWYDAVSGRMEEKKAKETLAELLKYCRLDTLAMVKVWDYLSPLEAQISEKGRKSKKIKILKDTAKMKKLLDLSQKKEIGDLEIF